MIRCVCTVRFVRFGLRAWKDCDKDPDGNKNMPAAKDKPGAATTKATGNLEQEHQQLL